MGAKLVPDQTQLFRGDLHTTEKHARKTFWFGVVSLLQGLGSLQSVIMNPASYERVLM